VPVVDAVEPRACILDEMAQHGVADEAAIGELAQRAFDVYLPGIEPACRGAELDGDATIILAHHALGPQGAHHRVMVAVVGRPGEQLLAHDEPTQRPA